jgi:7-dehydrocholesterol reductase
MRHAESIQQERVGPRWLRMTLLPLVLLLVCPPTAILVWYVHVHLGGSLAELGRLVVRVGPATAAAQIFRPVLLGTKTAWAMIGVFAMTELTLMRLLPGKPWDGPVTPTGNVPRYRANGVAAFTTTLGLFLGLAAAGVFPATIIYDHFGGLLGALNVFSLGFCLVLYLKGRFAPSTSDHGHTGNPIFDYYWGTELYPTLLGWNVKMFTNCRFGMMAWPLIILSFAARQRAHGGLSDAMIVAVGLQLVYIAKFFWWEAGYLRSLDIMHDRAGFYICWGCLVWVPSIYTAGTLYLVGHPRHLGTPVAAAVFALGVGAILTNYLADRQRQRVRATGGACTVWGRAPVLLTAHYTTAAGEARESLLLASGFWGLARHFHYVPEVAAAVLWTLPAGFHHVLPWFYVIFLAGLLTDRAFRDDNRCAAKYGADWDRYRAQVRWRIIPGLL